MKVLLWLCSIFYGINLINFKLFNKLLSEIDCLILIMLLRLFLFLWLLIFFKASKLTLLFIMNRLEVTPKIILLNYSILLICLLFYKVHFYPISLWSPDYYIKDTDIFLLLDYWANGKNKILVVKVILLVDSSTISHHLTHSLLWFMILYMLFLTFFLCLSLVLFFRGLGLKSVEVLLKMLLKVLRIKELLLKEELIDC